MFWFAWDNIGYVLQKIGKTSDCFRSVGARKIMYRSYEEDAYSHVDCEGRYEHSSE
jgi:hypothetical protein